MSLHWWAEGLGALALVINFIAYRQATVPRYLVISAVSLFCLSTHFFMLDAMAAGIGCLLSSVRNIIALWSRHRAILVLFIALNLGFLAYEWWVLSHPWIIFIAYSSVLIFTVGSLVIHDATTLRRWFILAESLGFIYAVWVGSIFGAIFNLSNLTSIVLTLRQTRAKAGYESP